MFVQGGGQMRKRPSAALIVALIALVFSLAGTAEASFLITSNSQVGPGTIAGHNPPSGDHANIVSGSVGTTDLHSHAVTGSKLAPAQKFVLVGTAGAPAFSNGGQGDCIWSNFTPADPFNPTGFYKDPFGVVHLTGVAQSVNGSGGDMHCGPSDAEDDIIFTLPAAYRPPHLALFATATGLDVAVVGVQDVMVNTTTYPAGSVFAYVGTPTAQPGGFALDGVEFRAAGPGTGISAARGVTRMSLRQFRTLVGGGGS
jgi:hypothetical protein